MSRIFAEVLGRIIDEIRAKGVITNAIENNGVYTIAYAQERGIDLISNEYVNIDGVDYKITVIDDKFTINAESGINFVGKEWKALAPYYLFGHYKSIADELIEKSLVPEYRDKKYPMILLGIDPEYRETDIDSTRYKVSFNIHILEETKEDWMTSERFENVFNRTLYPLYEKLIGAIFLHREVSSFLYEIEPVVEPIPYWGTQTIQGSDAQIVNDPLDAIKFKVNDLVINKNC